jgi:hypothetical protein
VRWTRMGVFGILDGRCGEACRRGAQGVFAWVLAMLTRVTQAAFVKVRSVPEGVVEGRDVKARVRTRHRTAGRIMASRRV